MYAIMYNIRAMIYNLYTKTKGDTRMDATNLTDFRNNIRKYLDKVIDDSDNLTITRPHGRNVVVMSQADYDNLIENMYIIGNPSNRKHLDKSIAEAKHGKLTKVNLNDL